jgi:hypothetical protein
MSCRVVTDIDMPESMGGVKLAAAYPTSRAN